MRRHRTLRAVFGRGQRVRRIGAFRLGEQRAQGGEGRLPLPGWIGEGDVQRAAIHDAAAVAHHGQQALRREADMQRAARGQQRGEAFNK
jgi:hypothetical protein